MFNGSSRLYLLRMVSPMFCAVSTMLLTPSSVATSRLWRLRLFLILAPSPWPLLLASSCPWLLATWLPCCRSFFLLKYSQFREVQPYQILSLFLHIHFSTIVDKYLDLDTVMD